MLTIIAACSFTVSYFAVDIVRAISIRRKLLDKPNERSSHKSPTPRLGGIGIGLGLLVAMLVTWAINDYTDTWLPVSMLAFLGIAGLGLLDDLRPLRASVRLILQLVVVSIYCCVEPCPSNLEIPIFGSCQLGWVAVPFSVLWITWMINLFNFMDGIDGIAAAQTIVSSMALLSIVQSGDLAIPVLLVGIVGSATGFLCHNFPPATIFMGDVGSTALGFILAAVINHTIVAQSPRFTLVSGCLVVLPFLFDATFTLVRRMLTGQKWYAAHRSHVYQRPQNWGWSHRRTTLVASTVMVLCAALGVVHYRCQGGFRDAIALAGFSLVAGVAALVLRQDARFPIEVSLHK